VGSTARVCHAPAARRSPERAEMLEMPLGAGDSTAMAEARRLPPMSHYSKATVTIVLTIAVLLAAWRVQSILILILIAAVLAIGLDPAVRRLERWHFRRGLAVATIFLATIVFLAVFLALVIPPVVREVSSLASDIPGKLRNSGGLIGDLQDKYDIAGKFETLTKNLPAAAGNSFKTILGLTKSVGTIIFNLLTIGILTIYFLMALPRARKTAPRFFLPENRERASAIIGESLEKVGGYVSGNITISIIAGLSSFLVLLVLGVPFAVALAMWVAITDLIPTVGATLGALVVVIVALLDSVFGGIATAIWFIAYQQIENYVIAPRVMKKAVDVSPAAVIISVLIGGALAGFAGALLALPVAAVIKVLVREFWLEDREAATTKS
jgi:predicted PurR-regulated permease PerM